MVAFVGNNKYERKKIKSLIKYVKIYNKSTCKKHKKEMLIKAIVIAVWASYYKSNPSPMHLFLILKT